MSGAKSSGSPSCSTRAPAESARGSREGRASASTTRGRSGTTRSRPHFQALNIIAAHFGYPWHTELLAMALHKTNIYIDISGWAPRYIPAEVLQDMKGRLQNQFVFGSDYPFIQPERCLDELATLEIPDAALQKVLVGNGKRLLGLS
ncbi:MAG TPA: amidohydrolase family protein [Candidatus Dormibacteraeota bacterium]